MDGSKTRSPLRLRALAAVLAGIAVVWLFGLGAVVGPAPALFFVAALALNPR